ncbi:MAG: hypothetical protein AB7V27_09240 [Candidatus Binatia bacterium]
MQIEHIDASIVRDLRDRVAAARRAASEALPEERRNADDPRYWQGLFEANAHAVLQSLGRVRLAEGRVVRYRFYGRSGRDLLVRPLVTRVGTDVDGVIGLLDWHPPPDAATGPRARNDQDVELLYRHFAIEPSAEGVFEYWVAMQELWASQRWVHSTVLADAQEFSQLTSGADWRIERPLERVEPAVMTGAEDGAHLAVLVHCPLERHAVTYHRVRMAPDQGIEFAESLPVAHGPRGLLS